MTFIASLYLTLKGFLCFLCFYLSVYNSSLLHGHFDQIYLNKLRACRHSYAWLMFNCLFLYFSYFSVSFFNVCSFFYVCPSFLCYSVSLCSFLGCIDGCHAIDRIKCSLVTPVNRQTQSDGYECRLFRCWDEIVKWMRHQIIIEY